MGQLYAGMDADGDNLETSCGDGVGMGIRVLGMVENGYKYLSPCSSLLCVMDIFMKYTASFVNCSIFW